MRDPKLSWGLIYNHSPTEKIRKFKHSLILSCAIALLCLPTKLIFPQSVTSAELKSWLPRTLSQALQESISKVVDHVTTREGCIDVLEAKVSESREQLNPKFIVTCSGMDNTTLNFVYWESDIKNSFSGVSYPEKQEKQVFSVAEQERLKLLKLRNDNKDLIDSCQVHLASKLSSKAPHYSENDVIISQRGEQLPVVYIEYSADQSEFSPLYTATCRFDISQSIRMTIFPRNRL